MTSAALDRAQFEAWDAADPLAQRRAQFVTPRHEQAIYANGNSLGRPPIETAPRLVELVDVWSSELTAGWKHWIDLPFEVGDRLGAACLGAAPGQVAIADSTSVNLYKAISAAMDGAPAGRTELLVAAEEFPTDRYLMQSLAAHRGIALRTVAAAGDIVAACDSATAVVVLSLVNYRSGELLDQREITGALRERGVTVVWDLSHAVGVVDVDLDASGVELAVGCTYKYVNGGPGAPAFLYVSHAAQTRLRQPLWGWFGQRDLFAMGEQYEPADGMRSWMVGTPNIAGTVAVDVGVGLIEAAGIEAIRAKSIALTTAAHLLAEEWLVPLGAHIASPADATERGAHVSIGHQLAESICEALVNQRLVVPDFRQPDVIRLGFAPLYTRFVDVWDAIDRTRSVMQEAR